MKIVLMKFFQITLLFLLNDFYNIIEVNDKLFLMIACSLIAVDTSLSVACRYIKDLSVTSKKFIIGISVKCVIMFLFLLLSIGFKYFIQFDIFKVLMIVYSLYEFKSIDEKVTILIGKSFIDDAANSVLFFLKLKNKIEHENDNTNTADKQ